MWEKLLWIALFSIRGSIHALPFLIGGLVISTGFFLPSEPPTGILSPLVEAISAYINLLGLGLSLIGFIIWLVTWMDDYQNDYLPKWVLSQI